MTNEPKASHGLDPELLAAYIDQRLTPEQRAVVEAQLASDPDSYAVLVETMKAQAHLETNRQTGVVPISNRRSPKVQWAISAGLLAAAASVLLTVWNGPELLQRLRGDRVDARFEKLVAAVGSERYIEGRLTGGFKYGPLKSGSRGTEDLAKTNLALVAAAAELQTQANSDSGMRAQHAWAIARLLMRDFDGAIQILETLANQQPRNDELQGDLAAAYLGRAQAAGRPEDLPRALAAVDRSLAINPRRSESLFNRAVILTALNLKEQAKSAWTDYVASDPSSEWADEARRKIAEIEQPLRGARWPEYRQGIMASEASESAGTIPDLVREFPQQMRELVEDELLPKWAAQRLAGDVKADRTLQQARFIASSLADANGDHLLRDVTFDAGSANDTTSLKLARGFEYYKEARRLYETNRVSDSVPVFTSAASEFASADSPMQLWCAHYLGIQEYYAGRLKSARAAQRRILTEADRYQYSALAARAHWMVGLTGTLEGDHELQIREYESALRHFVKLGERENQAAVRNLLSSAFLYVGDYRLVWRHSVAALSELGPLTGARRLHTTLTSAANKAVRNGLPEAALAFANEARSHADRWGAPEGVIESEQFRARALSLMGRHQDAMQAVEAARAHVNAVADPGIRLRLDAEVAQTEAEVAAPHDRGRAIASADRALAFFNAHRAFLRVPRLLMLKGRALAADGHRAEAASVLQESIESFERERRSLPPDDDTRISHADQQWGAYRDLIATLVEADASPLQLLEVAERSKSRTFRDTRSLDSGEPVITSIQALQASLPPSVGVLSYFVLANETLAWVVRRDGIHLSRLPTDANELESQISEFRARVEERHDKDWVARSGKLYDRLIAPLDLSGVEELLVSADGPLHQVSFPGLWNRKTASFLIQRFTVSSIPSAMGMQVGRALPLSGQLVAVAVPDGDPERGLDPLPNALIEAKQAAETFANSVLLVGDEVTAERLAEATKSASMLHFASHAIANTEFPSLSRLQIGSVGTETRWLTPRDLRRFETNSLSLAVLSACATLNGAISRSEGASSLGRALQANGVLDVIGTLWPVPDSETQQLMKSFYAALSTGGSPARSLALAQRTAIDQRLPAASWAAWSLQSARLTFDSDTPSPLTSQEN